MSSSPHDLASSTDFENRVRYTGQPPAVVGNRVWITKDLIKRVCEVAEAGLPAYLAAAYVGINARTFEIALDQGEECPDSPEGALAVAWHEARAKRARRKLGVLDESGDWKAAAWELERAFGFLKPAEKVTEAQKTASTLAELLVLAGADAVAVDSPRIDDASPPSSADPTGNQAE